MTRSTHESIIGLTNILLPKRTAHANTNTISHSLSTGKYSMLPLKTPKSMKHEMCDFVRQDKAMTKENVIEHTREPTVLLDVCSPSKLATIGGKLYFLIMTTAPSR